MDNVLNETLEEQQSNIRSQVKAKIRQVQNVKADLPKIIEDLRMKITLPIVKEAFGADFPEIQKIISLL